ncbi:TPA: hypothetical protein ACWL11_000539 [Escherichia coli]|nr:hypothetical protein [Escherichia coli]
MLAQITDYPGLVQIILSLHIWCSYNVYQESLFGILWHSFQDILIGISVKISLIDSFSSSVINALITEGGYLSKTDILMVFRPKLFGAK